jgi:hypothetical protein
VFILVESRLDQEMIRNGPLKAHFCVFPYRAIS